MDRYNDPCTCRFFKTVVNNTPVFVRTQTVKMCANNICSYTKCVIRARDNTEAFRKVLKSTKCKFLYRTWKHGKNSYYWHSGSEFRDYPFQKH